MHAYLGGRSEAYCMPKADCLQRARAVGVGLPSPEDLSDVALEARLFPASTALAAIKSRRTQADWPAIHREHRRHLAFSEGEADTLLDPR
jgi:hypothetical protein